MPTTRREILGAATAASLPLRAVARPNMLFLIADDLNADLACFGLPAVKTPNIDRLAARGVRFDRAYCQYPLCNPSRTSFLSGLRPETSRVFDQRTVYRQNDPGVEFLPDFFCRNGYFVAGTGKVFHHGKPNAAGFDDWQAAETASDEEAAAAKRRYANPEGNHTPDWAPIAGPEDKTADAIAARTVTAWMENSARTGKPFFLVAGFRKPHLPWAVPRRYFDLYPTLADLAGLRPPSHLEGRSLAPLLRRPNAAWDRPARSVVQREGVFGRAVRTERWRYVEWNAGQAGAELYDHSADPGEYRNLAADPKHGATVRRLRELLETGRG